MEVSSQLHGLAALLPGNIPDIYCRGDSFGSRACFETQSKRTVSVPAGKRTVILPTSTATHCSHPRNVQHRLSLYGSSVLMLDLGRFFSFLILYTVAETLWTGDQPVVRPLPTHSTAQTQNKRRHPCLE
jgi:hypothetical protein